MAELEDKQDNNPFSPTNVSQVNLIVLMRLYDIGLALLTHLDVDYAKAVAAAHEAGQVLGPLPWIDLSEPPQVSDEQLYAGNQG